MLSRYLLVITLLSISCQKVESDKRVDAPIKRVGQVEDELIINLISAKKIESFEAVSEELPLLSKKFRVDSILASYPVKGEYKTIVKVKSLSSDISKLKESLESKDHVEKAAYNFIYEGSPFDSDDVIYKDGNNPVELAAVHHKLIKTAEAWKHSKGEGGRG